MSSEEKIQEELAHAQSFIQKSLKHLIKIQEKLKLSLCEASAAEKVRDEAETIKASLYKNPENRERMSKLFSQYKKLLRTRKAVEGRLKQIELEIKQESSRLSKFQNFRQELGESIDDTYARFEILLVGVGLSAKTDPKKERLKKRGQEPAVGLPHFQSQEGLAILVGRNFKENEKLVMQLASPHDLWMHVKGRPGAHVIIRLSKGRPPSLETLLDAATIVAHYSKVSEGEKAEIDYAFRKYVKRAGAGSRHKKDSGTFLVTYTRGKTLMVTVELKRLERLKSSVR